MANLLINTTVGGNTVITTSNIGTYALTSLPSHNHDDRYFTETESDGRFQPLENQRLSTGNSPTFVDIYANEWFRNNNINEGLYNQATGTHFYSNGATSWAITGSGGNVQLEFRSNHQSTIRGFVYADTSNQIGFLNNAGDWSLRTNSSKDTQIYGALTVGSGTSADIYMTDTDETTRRIHTNSGRIGFLNAATNWGAYCDNTGNWFSDHSMRAPIFYDSADAAYYVDPNATTNIWRLQANDKYHYFGASSGWDTGSLNGANSSITNVHFQAHEDFWIGAGNTKWYTGVVSGHHDLLINTMQSGGNNVRGITFTASSGGASVYRLGRWFAHSTQVGSYLNVDGGIKIGGTTDTYSPPAAKLQVISSTSGSDVLAVDGVNGRLFTVTDDLSDSLFSVNTIAGLPVIEAFADNTVKIGKYGSNSITISGSKIAINSDTVDANFPFYVGDRSVAGARYSLTNKGMGFNLADNYAQLQLYGGNGSYIDFVTTSGQDSGGRIMWGSSFTISGDVYFNNPLYTYTLYDRNDTAYYLDMNGTSRLGTLNINQLSVYGNTYLGDGNGDEVHINDILRVGATDSGDAHFYFGEGGSAGSDYGSHWYWDSGYTFTWNTRNNGSDTAMFDYVTNDTTYINWRRNFHMQNREINYTAQLHFNGGTRFVTYNSNYLYFQPDSTSVGGILVRDGNSSIRGYSGYFDSNGFGLLNSSGGWGIRLNPGNVGTELFYAGDWRIRTRSDGAGVSGNLYTDQNYGHGLVGVYASDRYQGVFAMGDSYKLSADGTSSGSLYGIAWTHTNVGGQSKSGLGHQALFMANGSTQTAIGYGIWTVGLITTTDYGTSANWKSAYDWGNHASAGYQSASTAITTSNIGSQSVSYATTAGSLTSMNISQFTNNSGYLTSLPSHNHDDRYYTETESDNRYVPYGSITGSFGLNDNKLYLRTNNDNNHYIWNAADDWEEIVAYSGTGLRIASSTGVTLATFTTSGNSMNITGNAATATALTSMNISQFTNNSGYLTSITSGNVTTALGFTPYNATNPSGYISSITSGNVTTALGYTPYNATNPSGYITSYSETDTLGSVTNRGNSTSQNLVFSNGRKGLIGVYDPAQTQAIFAMGPAYILTDGGASATIGNLYGLAWSYNPDYGGAGNNPQSKAGLEHQLLLMNNGVTLTALGAGIWTSGLITTTSYGTSSNWNTAYSWGNHASAGYQAASTAITTSNIGSQSVSNASTAGGLAVHSSRNNEANKIVRTDANGYIQAGWINTPSGAFGSAINKIYCSDDDYVRYQTPANFISNLGLITTSSIGNQSVSYAVTAGSAGSVTGLTLNNSASPINPDNVTQNQIGYNTSVSLFGQTDGGLYSSAYSSSWIHQIYGDFRTGQIAIRGKNSGSWQAWRTVLDSSNYTSYAPSLTGSGASGSWGISVTGSAGSVAWTNVSSRPTALSQFTNDLGNYGGFLTSITAHSHAISDVTGLQTALDSKQASLGFTPYNSTNPSGYITGINSSAVTTALGFTPLSSSGNVTIGGYLTVTGAGTSSSIYMSDTDEGQREIHCNSNRIGFLTQAGAWGAYCDDSGNFFAANLSGTNTGDQTNISGNAATATYATTAGSAPANGGNSTTVGGYAPSGSVGANTVVIRDANNYIYAHYINSNVSETENPTINSFYTSNGDGWLRKSSVAHVKSQLGLGSLAYSSATIPTNNNQLTNGAGYITGINSGNVTTALGFTPYNATNPSGYITSSASISGNAATATNVAWTGVTSRPTALSQFSNDLGNYGGWLTTGGKAADSELLDGIDSGYFVRGNGVNTLGYRTTNHTGGNSAGGLSSGFYDGSGMSNMPTSDWYHLIVNSHYNSATNNQYEFQLATAFWNKSDFFVRSISPGDVGPWRTLVHNGNIGSQSVSYATISQQLTKFGDIYAQDWNSYFITGKLIVSNALGHTGTNRPSDSYGYGTVLSYGETGGPLMQMYFPEDVGNTGGAYRALAYRSGYNGGWSPWKTVVNQVGNTCTVAGSNGTGLQIHSNVSYNQNPLTYFLLRGQADSSWKTFKILLTGDAGGQDIEFRRIAENSTDARIFYVPRGLNQVIFDYTVVQPSDSRLKDNLTPITNPVDKIKSLRGVEFDWNSGEHVGTHDVGLIAQDVEAVLPEAVTTQEDGYKNLAYTKVIPLLVEAMKEQQTMIEALRAEVELLKNK